MRGRGAICVVLLGSALADTALAQVAVQQWRPSTETGGFVVLEPPSAPAGYGLGSGLWLQYAREPVVLPSGEHGEGVVVTDQVTANLVATFGLFDWLALSLDLPGSLYQGSGAVRFSWRNAAFADPRLLAKLVLLRPGVRGHGWGVSLLPEVGLPFGDQGSLLGESNFTFTPRIAVGYLAGDTLLVANFAYRFREGLPVGGLLVDDELHFGAGVEVPVPELPLAATLELTCATAAQRPFFDLKETSVEIFGSLRSRIGPIALQPGLAFGLTPGYLVPDFRIFAAVAWASRYRDADGDGLGDDVDPCIDEPEDHDDWLDGDGCPDPDNDGDGLLDRVDRCPDAPGPDANAGCPQETP